MRSLSHLDNSQSAGALVDKAVHYESVIKMDSRTVPGVAFHINKVSFGRRMELSRQIRDISKKTEFLDAGNQLSEKIETSLLAQEIDAMYLRWGLIKIDGLLIDGQIATVAELIDKGPEDLMREIVNAIRTQCGLSDSERKN